MALELPADRAIVERDTVRLVVQDAGGAVLVFAARERTLPDIG